MNDHRVVAPTRSVTPEASTIGAGVGRRAVCVVADAQPIVVEAVSRLLAEQGIEPVGQASDGGEALEIIRTLRPVMAVVDPMLPGLSGIEVTRRARSLVPETAVILYTSLVWRARLVEAHDAGARGFVLKEAPLEHLLHAVALAARGEVYVDPALASTLVFGGIAGDSPALSSRERDILRLLADGKSNEKIAGVLCISAHTVRTYVRRAMKKLDADTRTQAVATALRQCLIA